MVILLLFGGSYSYSYRHGYNTRNTPPKHIPYIPPTYTYSLYVATPTGWEYKTFTTTSNPTILKDQQIYKQYLIKRDSELAKIAGLAEFYLGQIPNPVLEKQIKDAKEIYKGGGIRKSPNEWEMLAENAKEYWKTFKEGIKNRDSKKIIIGGGFVAVATTIVTLDIIAEHSELIKAAYESIKEAIDTVKNPIYTTSH